MGKGPKDRAHIYTGSVSKLEETLVYTNIDDVAMTD